MKTAALVVVTSHCGRIACGLLLLLCGLNAGLPAAHATWGENFGSVHFNSGEPDFGTPPRRAVYAGDDSRPGGGGGLSGGPIYTEFSQTPELEAGQARRRARLHQTWEASLAREEWRRAKTQIEQEIQTLGVTGSLRDRVEVLDAVLQQPTRSPALTGALHTYFWALRVSGESPKQYAAANAAFQKVERDTNSPDFLRAHSLYQRASLSYQKNDAETALHLYQKMCQDFPHSSKKPAALLMAARSGLLLSSAKADAREAAKNALDQLRRDFPNRYSAPVQGLYGRYWYLKGNYGKAADIYFGLNDWVSLEVVRPFLPLEKRHTLGPRFLAADLYGMERAPNYFAYVTALKGVDREMQELTPEGARGFVQRLMNEPDLAAPYFYYRLYYTEAFAPENERGGELDESDRKIKARQAASRRTLLALAERIAGRSGVAQPRLTAPVRLRLAEVYYQEGQYPEALRWVGSVFAFPAPLASRFMNGMGGLTTNDRAMYVRGAIYQKQKRNREATGDFEQLLSHFPDSPLRPAAREELAILYEAANRNEAALNQYFALGYDEDIAYLLDVRMTTSEVAAYCAAHSRHPQSALLTYSLGVRQLRDDNLSAARRTLKRLPAKQYAELSKTFESESPDPLRVVDALVTLRQNIARAKTREARAQALYRHASFHYKNGLLLFYNAALWKGSRIFDFDVFWNRRQMTPKDRAAIRQHMYRHEVYVRVINQCRQIADDYPDTSAAPLALYRAACAADHLSGLNQWWESEENHRDFEGQAAALLRRLARRYPHHPLGHNARKYAHVFADEASEVKKAWARAQKHPGDMETALAY